MTVGERISATVGAVTEGPWRSIIRVFAIVFAIFGLILIGNEIIENIVSCNAGACARLHLGTMLWGVALATFGLLAIQKGDPKEALDDVLSGGSVVRGWLFTRIGRSTDAPGTKVTTVVEPPVEEKKP